MDMENPYEPPKSAPLPESLSGQSFGWQIVDGRMWVKSSAMFPKIDPYSGLTSPRMRKEKLLVRYHPRWHGMIPEACALTGALVFGGMQIGYELFISAVFGYLTGLGLTAVFSLNSPVITLHLHIDTTLKNPRHWARIADFMLFVALLGLIGLTNHFEQYLIWILLTSLALTMIRHMVFRKLRCPARDGERFEIRGFHRNAVDALAQMQTGGPQTAR
jgi:hypothetical protein